MKDYYGILGIEVSATPAQVRAVYRLMARKYHPDTSELPEAEATVRFQEISEAYAVLADDAAREQYTRKWNQARSRGVRFQPVAEEKRIIIRKTRRRVYTSFHKRGGLGRSRSRGRKAFTSGFNFKF